MIFRNNIYPVALRAVSDRLSVFDVTAADLSYVPCQRGTDKFAGVALAGYRSFARLSEANTVL